MRAGISFSSAQTRFWMNELTLKSSVERVRFAGKTHDRHGGLKTRLSRPLPGHKSPVRLAETLLSLLSSKPEDVRPDAHEQPSVDSALDLLCRMFPGFERDIAGKDVLDFGCGAGFQSAAMAMRGARFVLGLDTNPKTLQRARKLASELGLDGRVEFAETLPLRQAQDAQVLRQAQDAQAGFDVVISQNSMEHFPDPRAILEEMKSALRPGGVILVTFGPPWLAPYGSHMRFFTRVPWVNVAFPESAVMKVRSRFIDDGAVSYEDVEGGLNRMTVRKFERLVADCGLELGYRRYNCVKGLGFLAKLPLARELFINHVSCVLRQAQDAQITSSSDPAPASP
jgi:SAM-dependent methyltransferase